MFTSYITDADLRKYHPNLHKQLWATQATYATQIDEAYTRVSADLSNQGFNLRAIMVPLDLKKTDTAYTNPTATTELATTTGTSEQVSVDIDDARNYRRMVVSINTISGTWVIKLQGSNDNTNWYDVTGASITATTVGKQSVEFSEQYKYFRYVSVAGTSINYAVYLVETLLDKLITYKTFSIIFSDFRKAQNDSWDLLKREYDATYEAELAKAKFLYDEDDSGSTEDGETTGMSNQYMVF